MMIETIKEYNYLLNRLRNSKKTGKLNKHLLSKLEGLEEVEQLINKNDDIAGVMHIFKELAYDYITDHSHRDKDTDEILDSQLQPTKVRILMEWLETTIEDLIPLFE